MRPSPIPWLAAEVQELVVETPRVKTIRLVVPGWRGHVPGQHVDVRLTAQDGYQAQRSSSIASPPEQDGIALTVERLEDGEVSTFLTDELRPGDSLEVRGPLGGWFTWTVDQGVRSRSSRAAAASCRSWRWSGTAPRGRAASRRAFSARGARRRT